MSVLKEQQCYGLSSRKLGANVSVFHVKLTDSAARAIGTFQNGKGRLCSQPTICFSGNEGRISIPCSEDGGELRTFSFAVTNVACDNPHGSFDCVQQHNTGAAEELSCVGVIQKKMTVKATDDSYHQAQLSMAKVEEESRSRGAIVIKHGGRFRGKKIKKVVRAPAPALAKLAKPQHAAGSRKKDVIMSKPSKAASNRKSACVVEKRPLRERLTHLLALRPYRRPELLVRLHQDGLTAGEKVSLDTLLLEVGQLNSRDGTYVLKNGLYKELQKNWPGYNTGDQKLLKRILVRRLYQSQHSRLFVPEAQVSPLRETPNSSPAHAQRPNSSPAHAQRPNSSPAHAQRPNSSPAHAQRPNSSPAHAQRHDPTEEYTDPLASKKPRISHCSSKSPSDKSGSTASKTQPPKSFRRTEDYHSKNWLDPRKLFDSLSAACMQEAELAKRLEPEVSEGPAALPQPNPDRPPSPLTVPHLDRHLSKRKKRKHKHTDQEDRTRDEEGQTVKDPKKKKKKVSLDCTEASEMFCDSNVLQVTNDMTDYLTKYTVIQSQEQRQSYKQDFNQEYREYLDLHAHIDSVTHQFMELDTQLKQLQCGSNRYKTIHNQIVQEYQKIKKSNPNYNQDKIRCGYLHNKLAHIKKLISEYDQQQLSME